MDQSNQIDYKSLQMLLNLQIDINHIIMSESLREINKLNQIDIKVIDNIKDKINNNIKEYIQYIMNK